VSAEASGRARSLERQFDTLMNINIIKSMAIDSRVITFAKAIADETRQEMMKLLCCEWMSVNDVVAALGGRVNQPTVSHHLKLLAEANLVQVRQEGRQRFYSLNQEYFTVCCGSLMQNFAPTYASQGKGTANAVPIALTIE
jgi:ArsR family transcriptional regulator, arsenate/arsenite/antimonite-responsive transcriptional repressor